MIIVKVDFLEVMLLDVSDFLSNDELLQVHGWMLHFDISLHLLSLVKYNAFSIPKTWDTPSHIRIF